ncbi:hypothetical protein [Nocardia sp. NPDC059239]|uniref:hypothetical protein n=1 Tax=unclassified Nocardia TaxID=2637762 RepID=UPI0036CA979E
MTPAKIRAEAIERMARADYTGWLERVRGKYAQDGETCPHLPWDEQPDTGEWGRDRWRSDHAPNADALGEMLTASPKRRRSRASAKGAGTAFETLIARGLAAALGDDRIERRVRNGRKDRGDISGLRTHGGGRIVVECKDYGGRIEAAAWTAEAEEERGHDDALAGIVVAKRIGTTKFGDQYVLMRMRDLVAILTGRRNHII